MGAGGVEDFVRNRHDETFVSAVGAFNVPAVVQYPVGTRSSEQGDLAHFLPGSGERQASSAEIDRPGIESDRCPPAIPEIGRKLLLSGVRGEICWVELVACCGDGAVYVYSVSKCVVFGICFSW